MIEINKTIRIDLLTSIVFTLLLLSFIIFRLLNISNLILVSKYTIVLFLVWLILSILIRKNFTKRELILFIPLILFNVIYIINDNVTGNSDAFFIVLNHAIFFMVIYTIYNIAWTEFQMKIFSFMFFVSFPILLIISFVISDVLNTNSIGAYSYFLAFFPLLYMVGYSKTLKRSQIAMIFILAGILILASDSRSIFLSIGFSILTYFGWRFLSRNKILFYIYFFAVVGFGYWFTFIYPKIYTWNSFHKINELSLRFSDKPLLTGRERIWERLANYIAQKPFFGYGSSTLPGDFASSNLSAHNTYLQVGLQTGIIGILLLLLFFFFIWKSLWNARQDSKIVLASSFFIGIIVYQLFEVNLTQSNFGLGLIQWTIIGFLLSFSRKYQY